MDDEFKVEFAETFSTEKCLPNPTRPSRGSILSQSLIMLGWFILILVQGYMLRLRGVLMGRMYPKIERDRIR